MSFATFPELPSPWPEFLSALDDRLRERVALHCLGGFVIAACYGFDRPTGDLDYISVVPDDQRATVEALAGRDSALAMTHRVHLQDVTVASVPENYDLRLHELHPGRFRCLGLHVLDPYDLVLSKLARNTPVDREDVGRVVRVASLDPVVLQERYRRELRPIIIGDPDRHDRTLEMWMDAYFS